MKQMNMNPPNFETLGKKRKEKDGEGAFPQDLSLRVHRAISWGKRAEQEKEDLDARFIFLWIGFNAAYARDPDKKQNRAWERGYQNYFRILNSCDKEKRIHTAVWERFSQEIRVLLANEYVFRHFWDFHHKIISEEDWRREQQKERRRIRHAMKKGNTPRVLSAIFDRLYVLRNQLIHGGATWKGRVNRDQVRDGANIMSWMLPIFVGIMMDNPHEEWGPPFYPVVDDGHTGAKQKKDGK